MSQKRSRGDEEEEKEEEDAGEPPARRQRLADDPDLPVGDYLMDQMLEKEAQQVRAQRDAAGEPRRRRTRARPPTVTLRPPYPLYAFWQRPLRSPLCSARPSWRCLCASAHPRPPSSGRSSDYVFPARFLG